MEHIKTYFELTKPGIVLSNTLAVVAGAFLASSFTGLMPLMTFLGVVIGTALIIASAGVVNNYTDRSIDAQMVRTKKRVLASGQFSGTVALVYGVILAVLGFGLLIVFTNLLTVVLGLVAYVVYTVIYGLAKRRSEHGTLVGSIAGALPPVAGYAAITNNLDVATLLLFVIWVAWQMAHFYSIAIFRRAEYQAAGVPLLTVVRGVQPAKEQIVIYAAAYIISVFELTIAGYTGVIFMLVMAAVGAVWLALSIKLLRTNDPHREISDARKLFGFSLITLITMCVMIAVGGFLP